MDKTFIGHYLTTMFFDILIVLANFLFLFRINHLFSKSSLSYKRDTKVLKLLFVFHQFLSLFFSFYVLKFGGDAGGYWFLNNVRGLNKPWESYYGTGTTFINFLCYPLVKYLGVSFYCGGLLFGFVGFIGFINIYRIVRKFVRKDVILYSFSIFPFLLFLPNLNFWTAGVGKDSLTFFGIMLFFNCLFNYKRRLLTGLFAAILIYHIRPPMAMFLILSTFGGVLFDSKLKKTYKVFLSIVMFAAGLMLFSKVMDSLSMETLDADSIEHFSETRAGNLSRDAGSGVNTTDYPIPLKVFTFLYRPLFFDVNGPLAVLASFENLVLLWLSFLLIFKLKMLNALKKAPFQLKTLLFYFIIVSFAFSLILGNLGIMLRMKVMVVPALLIFIFWCVELLNVQKLKKRPVRNET